MVVEIEGDCYEIIFLWLPIDYLLDNLQNLPKEALIKLARADGKRSAICRRRFIQRVPNSHYGIRQFRSLRGVTFLSPNKKVTKEVGLRGKLELPLETRSP